jgi:hypothetical protein
LISAATVELVDASVASASRHDKEASLFLYAIVALIVYSELIYYYVGLLQINSKPPRNTQTESQKRFVLLAEDLHVELIWVVVGVIDAGNGVCKRRRIWKASRSSSAT